MQIKSNYLMNVFRSIRNKPEIQLTVFIIFVFTVNISDSTTAINSIIVLTIEIVYPYEKLR